MMKASDLHLAMFGLSVAVWHVQVDSFRVERCRLEEFRWYQIKISDASIR